MQYRGKLEGPRKKCRCKRDLLQFSHGLLVVFPITIFVHHLKTENENVIPPRARQVDCANLQLVLETLILLFQA